MPAKQVLKPSILNAHVGPGVKFWALISYSADPYRPTREQQNRETGVTETVANLVPFIKKVYADKESAQKDADELFDAHSATTESTSPAGKDYPEKWSSVSWASAKPEIMKSIRKQQPLAEIAKDYDTTIDWVIRVRDEMK